MNRSHLQLSPEGTSHHPLDPSRSHCKRKEIFLLVVGILLQRHHPALPLPRPPCEPSMGKLPEALGPWGLYSHRPPMKGEWLWVFCLVGSDRAWVMEVEQKVRDDWPVRTCRDFRGPWASSTLPTWGGDSCLIFTFPQDNQESEAV